MRAEIISDLWWKTAMVYCVDVKAFQDGDGDGVGDFKGLIQRLDYFAGLGVTCLWLLPICPSPWRDNGYDVADYYNVDPRLGTLGDVVEFLRAARELGLRVITDLVVNHTSDEHPWFRQSRASRDNPYRDWYVWRDRPEKQPAGLTFPGEEDSNWRLDERTGQYYLHRFYHFQPDLNIENPEVQAEIRKIMGFWLEIGLSGFRVDAVPFLIETGGIPGKSPDDPHAPLRDMRGFLNRRRGDAMLLGEANLPATELGGYFGEHGDELHMLFNFLLNQWVHLAFVRHDPEPIRDHLRELPRPPLNCQFASFIRNADELSLDKLAGAERDEVFAAFAPQEHMRIYERGIRRRFAPMVGGDQRRLELAYSLLLSLPGAPVLLYGDELGMGDDLRVPGRGSVRCAMQWSAETNAGFSPAPRVAVPVVRDGPFGHRRVNVAAQRRNPRSLLRRVTRLIRVFRECPETALGEWTVLDPGEPSVLALRYDWLGGSVVTLHNFADATCRARLALEGRLEDLLGAGDAAPDRDADTEVELPPYGYRWFRLHAGPR